MYLEKDEVKATVYQPRLKNRSAGKFTCLADGARTRSVSQSVSQSIQPPSHSPDATDTPEDQSSHINHKTRPSLKGYMYLYINELYVNHIIWATPFIFKVQFHGRYTSEDQSSHTNHERRPSLKGYIYIYILMCCMSIILYERHRLFLKCSTMGDIHRKTSPAT